MSAHRFYVPAERWSGHKLVFDDGESHHCVDVLRLEVGSRAIAFDGAGTEAIIELQAIDRGSVEALIISQSKTPALRCAITLAQAIPKGKNMELIVQKAAELGVRRIVPLLSERTIVQLDAEEGTKRIEKWQQIVIEAAKQCGQNWLPQITEPITPKRFFAEFDRYELPLIASLQSDARNFKHVLNDFRDHHGRRPTNAIILVGPEGDFTPAESSLAKSAGCIPVSLGPIVLRTETAAIYCLSVLGYELQGEEG